MKDDYYKWLASFIYNLGIGLKGHVFWKIMSLKKLNKLKVVICFILLLLLQILCYLILLYLNYDNIVDILKSIYQHFIYHYWIS